VPVQTSWEIPSLIKEKSFTIEFALFLNAKFVVLIHQSYLFLFIPDITLLLQASHGLYYNTSQSHTLLPYI
jgi:hypothetical protein